MILLISIVWPSYARSDLPLLNDSQWSSRILLFQVVVKTLQRMLLSALQLMVHISTTTSSSTCRFFSTSPPSMCQLIRVFVLSNYKLLSANPLYLPSTFMRSPFFVSLKLSVTLVPPLQRWSAHWWALCSRPSRATGTISGSRSRRWAPPSVPSTPPSRHRARAVWWRAPPRQRRQRLPAALRARARALGRKLWASRTWGRVCWAHTSRCSTWPTTSSTRSRRSAASSPPWAIRRPLASASRPASSWGIVHYYLAADKHRFDSYTLLYVSYNKYCKCTVLFAVWLACIRSSFRSWNKPSKC